MHVERRLTIRNNFFTPTIIYKTLNLVAAQLLNNLLPKVRKHLVANSCPRMPLAT